MHRLSRSTRAVLALAVLVGSLAAPAAALGVDGEIGDVGDTDSITDVFVAADGRAAVNVDYVRDCAAGGTQDCWIELSFRYKCPEFWCTDWTYQPYRRIPSTGAARANCNGSPNDDNYWEVSYRVATRLRRRGRSSGTAKRRRSCAPSRVAGGCRASSWNRCSTSTSTRA